MFSKILIPLDGTPEAEAALEPAAEIARRFEAGVILLEVTPGYGQVIGATAAEPLGAGVGAIQVAAEAAAEAEASASQYLERVRAEFGTPEWRTEVAEGNAPSAILECARHNATDLIIMATHGRSGLKRLFLGSVADDVIRKSGVPVLVVHVDRDDSD